MTNSILARAGYMLKAGLSVDEIVSKTGLTIEQVAAISANQDAKPAPPSLEEKLSEPPFDHALMGWVDG